jgi:excisionase family DNA binding protein
MVADEDGVELTLPEAAAVLGVSVDTVRRHIKRGELSVRKDARGRVRVLPMSSPQPAEAVENARLRDELAQTQRDLREALWHKAAMASELEALREQNKGQLSLEAWSPLLHAWPLGGPIDRATQRLQRHRISAKIDEARRLAGSRRDAVQTLDR